jgi:ketosteroid isomerase-like protein
MTITGRCGIAAFLSAMLVAPARADDKGDIRRLEDRLVAAFKAKNVDGIMASYAPDEGLVVFDAIPPRQYAGPKAWRKDNENFLANYPGPIDADISDLTITADGKLGFARYVLHMAGTNKAGARDEFAFRATDCLQKWKGKWLIVHEHLSFPVDPATGKADLLSKP